MRCEKPKANHGRYMPTPTYVAMPAAHLAGAGFRNGKEYMCAPWIGCEYTAHACESTARSAPNEQHAARQAFAAAQPEAAQPSSLLRGCRRPGYHRCRVTQRNPHSRANKRSLHTHTPPPPPHTPVVPRTSRRNALRLREWSSYACTYDLATRGFVRGILPVLRLDVAGEAYVRHGMSSPTKVAPLRAKRCAHGLAERCCATCGDGLHLGAPLFTPGSPSPCQAATATIDCRL